MIKVIEEETGHFSSKKIFWSKRHARFLDDFLVHIFNITQEKEQALESQGEPIQNLPVILDDEYDYQVSKTYTENDGFIMRSDLELLASVNKQLDEYREMIETIETHTAWFSFPKSKETKEIAKRIDDYLVHLFKLRNRTTPEESNKLYPEGMLHVRCISKIILSKRGLNETNTNSHFQNTKIS